jgi:hypothetical protein
MCISEQEQLIRMMLLTFFKQHHHQHLSSVCSEVTRSVSVCYMLDDPGISNIAWRAATMVKMMRLYSTSTTHLHSHNRNN